MQLAAIYVPLLQYLFDTIALSFSDLLYASIVSSLVFFADELRKYVIRDRTRVPFSDLEAGNRKRG